MACITASCRNPNQPAQLSFHSSSIFFGLSYISQKCSYQFKPTQLKQTLNIHPQPPFLTENIQLIHTPLFPALSSSALAATCTAPNAATFDNAAIDMIGSIEALLCGNARWGSITAYPEGGWCGNGGGFTYDGFWAITVMGSSSERWASTDTLLPLARERGEEKRGGMEERRKGVGFGEVY